MTRRDWSFKIQLGAIAETRKKRGVRTPLSLVATRAALTGSTAVNYTAQV